MCIQPADTVNVVGASRLRDFGRPEGRTEARPVNASLTASARSRGVALGDDAGPMVDGLARLADSLGEGVLAIEVLPLAAVVELDEMAERAAGAKKLPFGVLALDFGGKGLGHGPWHCTLKARSVIESRKN